MSAGISWYNEYIQAPVLLVRAGALFVCRCGQTSLVEVVCVRRMMALLMAGLMMGLAACGRPSAAVRIAGSTSVQPVVEVLAEAYRRAGGERVTIQGGGSTAGVQAVLTGVASVGAVSRRLTAAESAQGLVAHTMGQDLLVLVVHPANPVAGLTLPQLRRLFAGEAVDWAELGGRSGPVHLVSREAGSGSREAFREMIGPVSPRAIVQSSAGAIRLAVAGDPQAVGYVNLSALQAGGVKPLRVDERAPGQPGYPLARPLALVTRGEPSGEVAAFLRFVRSSAGQRLVAEEGLVPVDAKSDRP